MKLYPSIHDAITKLREVGIGEFDQSLADYGCPSDTIPFLAKHYGHRLVLRSEYWHSGKDEYADELLSDRSDAIA